MNSELGKEAHDLRSAPADDAQGWSQDTSNGIPWRTSKGPPPEPDAFPVEWQLSPEEKEDEASVAKQVSRDEDARMFQRRLLRLYRVYYPPPARD
jgi:hypothetical protein